MKVGSKFVRTCALSILVSLPASWCSPAAAGDSDQEWFWFSECGSGAIILEVIFDGHTIHKERIPICRSDRDDEASAGEAKRISIPFTPERKIAWYGYRYKKEWSPKMVPLVVDIWEASAGPDDMLLGVSVSSAEKIYMNTVMVSPPRKPVQAEIGGGLTVRTYADHGT